MTLLYICKNPDYGVENDPDSLLQAMNSKESELWYNAMKENMNSM